MVFYVIPSFSGLFKDLGTDLPFLTQALMDSSIFLQNQYSMTGYTREEMVNHKDKLYELGGTLPDQHFKWDKKLEAEKHGNVHG